MIVSNSTPLIYLAKLGRLQLLKESFKKVVIPAAVHNEVVVVGKKKNYIDAGIVEKAVHEGWIEVRAAKPLEILSEVGIDKGELEAISLASEMKTCVLIDQTSARIAAELIDLRPCGTIYVLFDALKRKRVSYDEYLGLLEALISHGFRMSEEVYLEAVKMGRELSGKKAGE